MFGKVLSKLMMVKSALWKTENLSNICVKVTSVLSIDHFTVVCLVAWPLNENEAGGDLVLIETSMLFQ